MNTLAMDENSGSELDTEIRIEIEDNIECIGTAEDSGFASISGSVNTESITIAKDDELLSGNEAGKKIEEKSSISKQDALLERKRKREAEAENNLRAAEQYNQEVREQRYKRLMHLLDRSQFYSSYLVQKINQSLKKEPKKSLADKRKIPASTTTTIVDENSPPMKKTRKPKREKQDYDISEYVTMKDMQGKTDKKSLNLSQEDIANELTTPTDGIERKTNSQNSQPVNLKYFVGELRNYQIEGLQWLRVLYENGVNGILADEMGLGKTIQVIALICHLVEKKIPGPYLIIVPLSTMPNWIMEFENFAPKIPVIAFHGTPEERQKMYRKIERTNHNVDGYLTQPVVLMTFETPMSEPRLMMNQKWRYIIIDEGHRVKNYKCLLLRLLKKCQSMNRLLLTGTPLQNNLSELWALLNFLLPEIFNDLAVFESWFDARELQNNEGTQRILKQEAEKNVLSTLREILKPFMLRRMKTDVCLEIPPKKEIIVYAPLTELQHSLYKAVLTRDIQTMSKIEEQSLIIPDVDGRRPRRKCRDKIDLSQSFVDNMSDESSSRASTPSYEDDYNTWKKDTTIESGSLAAWKQYTDVSDRNREFLIRIGWTNRLVMYKKIVNHPYLVHCPLNDAGLPLIDDELITSSGKLRVLDTMLAKLKARGHKVLLFSTMTMILDMIEDYLEMRDYLYVRLDGSYKINDRKNNIKSFNSDPNVFLFLISTRAGGIGLNLTAADTVIIYDSDWKKMECMGDFSNINEDLGLIFSNFLSTSGKLSSSRTEASSIISKVGFLKSHKYYGYKRYRESQRDLKNIFLGSARLEERLLEVREQFEMNPQADIQAMARCHRIGQTKPVVVYKLCTKGTIDERIITRAEAKRKLEKMVISSDIKNINLNNFDTLLELQKLLTSTSNQVVKPENDVFTPKELDKILDRSDLMPNPKVGTKNEKSKK